VKKKTPSRSRGKTRGSLLRSKAAKKGWAARRKAKKARSVAARKGWETRRRIKRTGIDTREVLVELVDRTSKFGEVEMQSFYTELQQKWHVYRVGLAEPIDLSRAIDVFMKCKPVLTKKYKRKAIVRGRLLSFDDETRISGHWYSITATYKIEDVFEQLEAELDVWSYRNTPSSGYDAIDAFEIAVEAV